MSTVTVSRMRAQVDVHVAVPRPAHGERGRQRHRLVLLAGQLGEPAGDVQVGRRQHAGLVELAQQAGGAEDQSRIAHAAPVSSTSLSAVTSSPDGCQANTPAGDCGPVIPRTNR